MAGNNVLWRAFPPVIIVVLLGCGNRGDKTAHTAQAIATVEDGGMGMGEGGGMGTGEGGGIGTTSSDGGSQIDPFRIGNDLPVSPPTQSASSQPVVEAPTISDEIAAASSLTVATCTGATPRMSGTSGQPEEIVTDYSVSVVERLRGSAPIEFTLPGGEFGDLTFTSYHTPTLSIGSTYLLIQVENPSTHINEFVSAYHVRDDGAVRFPGIWVNMNQVRQTAIGMAQ